nr:MAG TPA: hypothetical protein [Caudoviricetes sp.]
MRLYEGINLHSIISEKINKIYTFTILGYAFAEKQYNNVYFCFLYSLKYNLYIRQDLIDKANKCSYN